MSDPIEIPRQFVISVSDFLQNYLATIKPADKATLPDLSLAENAPFDERHKKLKQALYFLAKEQPGKEDVEAFAFFFESVYKVEDTTQEKYRHRYSDVCEVIFSDLVVGETGIPASIDMLLTNIEIVKQYIENNGAGREAQPYCIRCLNKLADHIRLESIRINYMTRQYDETHQELVRESRQLQDDIDNANEHYEALQEKYVKAQRDYIAILGIFSAVVMAVVGGMAFTSESFSALASAPIYNIAAIACIVGAILIDIVYMVFKFLRDMTSFDNTDGATPFSADILACINVMLFIFSIVFLVWPYISLLNS